MRFELIRASQASDDIWHAASQLHAQCDGMGDPMFHPDFARLLADIRKDTHLACGFDDEGLAAFWGLHARAGGWTRPLGGPFSDWHAPLLRESLALDPLDVLAGTGLNGMTVFGYRPRIGEACRAGHRYGAHLTLLHDGFDAWQTVQKARFNKHFKNMRRIHRNVERDFSEIVYNMDDQSDATFTRVIELKRAQYVETGRHDVMAADWARRFIDALRGHGAPHLHVRTASLYLDGVFAAAEMNLCSADTVHGWITVFDSQFGTYSPGYLVTHALIEDMPSRGQVIYDSGWGLDRYKRYVSNAMVPIDAGVLRTHQCGATPSRLLGSGWRSAEKVLPGKAGDLMGKVRRRSDQILISEPDLGGRVSGFMNAVRRPGT